ncbi:MAG: ROK family protein, partial [Vallitaleaceae bacterium]|nr:ROK family protein [Vallitaleaceae bacterium]
INCIINPKVVVLSGLCFSKVAIRNIQSLIKEHLPAIHVPELCFEKDFHDSYMSGLTSLALGTLSCQYQIIEK